ncbi:uncharacterized protein PV09_00818 [Verruconis gallopava]|uniref:Aquaporin n=1 Tax=Verruconis gallopava TaxID=253628 RepID=A0A0D1Y1E6_9PEZI|nr:uncharacterized protein PV09_00818 [Verruconis gallopava]KIW08896.1 hypothetical protein PV09_00818 [Verruconis gallopava]
MSSSKMPVLPVTNDDTRSHPRKERRLRYLSFIPNVVRNETIAFLGEFAGTFMFLFMAFAATQIANSTTPPPADSNAFQYPNPTNLLFISLAFGFSLAVNVWAFYRISGGLFNPAVTVGLYIVGAIGHVRAISSFLAQIAAAISSAAVVSALFPGPLNVNTTLAGRTSIAQGVFIEAFLTAELVFVIFMLAVEKHKATFLAPIGIGLALFISEMCGVYFTGGSLNPARSFGPAVVTRQFKGYHWIYWVGPVTGSLIASGFYKLMKYGEYRTANPGQDFDDHEAELFDLPTTAATAEDVARPNVSAVAVQRSIESPATGSTLSPAYSGVPLSTAEFRSLSTPEDNRRSSSMTYGADNDEVGKK